MRRQGLGCRNAGESRWMHIMAGNSRGHLFATEVDTARRGQRFRLVTHLSR